VPILAKKRSQGSLPPPPSRRKRGLKNPKKEVWKFFVSKIKKKAGKRQKSKKEA